MMFWGSLRADGQQALKAAYVVGHQHLGTLRVGESFKGSMYWPFEPMSAMGLCADRNGRDHIGEIWSEAVGWGGSAGKVVAGEGGRQARWKV